MLPVQLTGERNRSSGTYRTITGVYTWLAIVNVNSLQGSIMASIITKIEVRGLLMQSGIYSATLLNMAASDLPCTSPMALRTRRNARWHSRVGRRHARGTHGGDRGSIPGHHPAIRWVGCRQDSRYLAAQLSVEVLQGRTRAHGNSSFIHVLTYVVDL